jgi:hypothetical protein
MHLDCKLDLTWAFYECWRQALNRVQGLVLKGTAPDVIEKFNDKLEHLRDTMQQLQARRGESNTALETEAYRCVTEFKQDGAALVNYSRVHALFESAPIAHKMYAVAVRAHSLINYWFDQLQRVSILV